MSTANYSRVYHRIWSNKQFRSASRDARDAALYLLSCPHRNTEGLFRLPIPFAMFDLQWDEETTRSAFAELTQIRFIELDADNDLVLIVNALKWQTPAGKDRIKGAVNALSELPDTPLSVRFMEAAETVCPELADQLRDTLGWASETVSTPSPDSLGTVSGQSRDHVEYSSSISSSTSPSSSSSTTTSNPQSAAAESGGKVTTIEQARTACLTAGWTHEEIDQELADVPTDPKVRSPDAVKLTRLRKLCQRQPPGMTVDCATCSGMAMVEVDDGATQCPDCDGRGRHPLAERVDQSDF